MSTASFAVEVLFDGACPLCQNEIRFLRWHDRRGKIRLTDISQPPFEAYQYGKSTAGFVEEIQGRLPDGIWIHGVEVFRRLYAAIGWQPMVRLTRLPLISHGVDLAYMIFARNRLKLTGRARRKALSSESAARPNQSMKCLPAMFGHLTASIYLESDATLHRFFTDWCTTSSLFSAILCR